MGADWSFAIWRLDAEVRKEDSSTGPELFSIIANGASLRSGGIP